MALAGAVVGLLGAPLGWLAAVAAAGAWYALGAPAAFAVLAVGVAALAGEWTPAERVVALGSAVLVVLAPDLPEEPRLAAGTLLAAAALGGLAVLAQVAWDRTWVTAGVLLGAVALAGYALHRYERVATGVVGGES